MTNKLDLAVQQISELEICGLQGGEMLGGDGGIKITWLDA